MRPRAPVLLLTLVGLAVVLGAQDSLRHRAGPWPTLSEAQRSQAWSAMATKIACADVAQLAKLEFTPPIELLDGAWTARGTVHLKDTSNGITHATFLCRLSETSDRFEVGEPALTKGP